MSTIAPDLENDLHSQENTFDAFYEDYDFGESDIEEPDSPAVQCTPSCSSDDCPLQLDQSTWYLHGFIVEKRLDGSKRIANPSPYYRERKKTVFRVLGLRYLVTDFSSNIHNDFVCLFHMADWAYQIIDGVKVMAIPIFTNKSKSYVWREPPLTVPHLVDMEPTVTRESELPKGGCLERFFHKNVDVDIFLGASDTALPVYVGAFEVYKSLQDQFEESTRSTLYTGNSVLVKRSLDLFIRKLQEATTDNYGHVFACLACLIYRARTIPEFEGVCSRPLAEIRDSVDEFVGGLARLLFEELISPTSKLLPRLVQPILFNYASKRYYSGHTCHKRVAALKHLSKLVLFLNLSPAEFALFVENPESYATYRYFNVLYNSLFNEAKETRAFLVSELSFGRLSIDNTTLSIEYFNKLYFGLLKEFHRSFKQLAQLCGCDHAIDEIYTKFVAAASSGGDHTRMSLIAGMKNGFFNIPKRSSDVLALVDHLIRCCYSLVLVTSANSYRSTELSRATIGAATAVDRNVIYRNQRIAFVSFTGKNRLFQYRERYYNVDVSKVVVAVSLALKPLLLSVLRESLTVERIEEHRCCLFILSNGSYADFDSFYSISAMVLSISKDQVVRLRIMRQAYAFWIRTYVKKANMDSISKLTESIQGHSYRTGTAIYGVESGWSAQLSTSDSSLSFQFFEAFNRFFGFGSPADDATGLVVAKKSPVSLPFQPFCELEDVRRGGDIVGYKESNFVQHSLILDVCWSPTTSVMVQAVTGFGKTMIYHIPLVAAKLAFQRGFLPKRMVSVVLVPYKALLAGFNLLLSKLLTTLPAANIESFHAGVDLIVGTFDSLAANEIVEFISNFQSLDFAQHLFLGLFVIDEVQLLEQEETFRHFTTRMKFDCLKHFRKVVSMGATIGVGGLPTFSASLRDPVMRNTVATCPNNKVFTISKRVVGCKRLSAFLFTFVANVLSFDSSAKVLIYYNSKSKVNAHYNALAQNYSGVIERITRESTDVEQIIENFDATRLVLATKAASSGFNLPELKVVLFYDCALPVEEILQVVGRLRNHDLVAGFLYNSPVCYPDTFNPSGCFTVATREYYGVDVDNQNHQNCCHVDHAEDDSVTEIAKLLFVEPTVSPAKRRKVVCAEPTKSSRVEKIEEQFLELQREFPFFGLAGIGYGLIKRLENFVSTPVSQRDGSCLKCYSVNNECTPRECKYKKTVNLILGMRLMLGDIVFSDVSRIIKNSLGPSQLEWFEENQPHLGHLLTCYDNKLNTCTFLHGVVDILQKFDVQDQYEDVLRALAKYDASEWVYRVSGSPVLNVSTITEFGEFGPLWQNTVKRIYFEHPEITLCERCGCSIKEDRHQCANPDAIVYFYTIFSLQRFSRYRGDVQIFHHWVRSLVTCVNPMMHQVVLVAAFRQACSAL
ncbi:Y' element ATP-dependent helicase protein 1 copy 6 [Candida viswanathii]|uniref:ATP-dependent RNA helicase n=1 Tax=Candida viswanathii TaxID=5486 RepID=A0A367YLE5_9ASCO|nr:Y' element ATP-dependent helicase protein 1 copy 6 [Candida viswanathii]RCK66597.1 Y' element ATP-dependent helicase protein 1 copy 6 [Candida viswanathii]